MSIILRSRKTLAQRYRGVLKKYSTSHLWDFGVPQSALAYAASHTAAEFIAAYPLWPLWRDTAGTVPACKINDPVGLCLDQGGGGVVLGGDLTPQGTSWTPFNSTISSANCPITTTSASGTNYGAQAVDKLTVGKTYRVTVEWSGNANNRSLILNSAGAPTIDLPGVAGTRSFVFVAATAITYVALKAAAAAGETFTIVSVKTEEIIGAHASQATTTKRPILSGRVNQLLNSTLAGGTSGTWGSGAVAPTGWASGIGTGSVVFSLGTARFTSAAQRPFIGENVTLAVGSYILSLRAESGSFSALAGLIGTAAITAAVSGIGFKKNGVAATGAETVGAGDVIATTFSITTAGTITMRMGIGCTGAATGDITLSQPDLRPFNSPTNIPAYQRVTSATDYDTVGFPVRALFDGVDDCLVVPLLDLSMTDKVTVVAGVTKLSDAADGCIFGFGSLSGGGVGTLDLSAPGSDTAAKMQFASRRTTTVVPYTTSSAYNAPLSAVATAVSQISAPSALLRINGATVATMATTQGSGNYGRWPLYIGQRTGTTTPFNGAIQSLAIIGNLLPDGEVQILEASANAAMGKVY